MPTPEEFIEFSRCYAYAAHRVERRMAAIYDAALAPSGLTLRQFAVLAETAYAPGLPVARLARRLTVDPTTLTRALKPLIAKGWVTLETAPEDARVKRVSPTEKGRAVLERAAPMWRCAQGAVAQALGKAEADALSHALEDAARRLKRAAAA